MQWLEQQDLRPAEDFWRIVKLTCDEKGLRTMNSGKRMLLRLFTYYKEIEDGREREESLRLVPKASSDNV